MEEEHQELHRELAKATEIRGKVGEAARKVAQVLHPHFVKENEVALPVVGVARELAEGKTLLDFGEVLELHDKFKNEYEKMLQEHSEIVNALDVLEKTARTTKKHEVVDFARKLKVHAKIEEDLTYPAVLMIGKLIRQSQGAQPSRIQ